MNIRKIRKAELHCHLDGLLNPQILKGLLPDQRVRELMTKLKKVCPVKDLRSWVEQYYPVIEPAVSNQGEFLLEILGRHLKFLKKQNVVYSEIMLTSFLFQYAEIEEQIALYRRFREAAAAIGGETLTIEFLIAFGRTSDRAKMEKKAERILALSRAGLIAGVAAAGLEEENTIKPYADIFREFKKAGLGIEIHAGEWKGPELIWEALEYGQADRIGHGLALSEDPELVGYLRKNQIHLEFCPTSNRLLTKHRRLADHPIKIAIEAGISFSINTDDPGPFGTTLTREFELVGRTFGLTENDFGKILNQSLTAAFAPGRP